MGNYKHFNDVKRILILFPKTRDDDWLLYLTLCRESGILPLYSDFDILLSLGSIINYDTIRSARQRLQNRFPELRGNKYKTTRCYDSFVKYRFSPDKYLFDVS